MLLKKYWAVMPLAFLCACGNANFKSGAPSNDVAASAKQEYLSTADSTNFSSDIASLTSSSRKIIHTAYFKCRVDNAYKATADLENLVRSKNGVVEESKIQTSVSEDRTMKYKPDSLKEVRIYQTNATLTLRVPVTSLDTILQAVPHMAIFMEERNLSQDDVTLRYLANALKNEPSKNNYTNRALKNAKKSDEVLNVSQYEDDKKEQTVNRRVDNLQLLEDVNYATIHILLQQPEQVDAQVIVNADYYTRPSFGTQLAASLGYGFEMLRELILAIVSAWPVWVLAVALAFIIRKVLKRRYAWARK